MATTKRQGPRGIPGPRGPAGAAGSRGIKGRRGIYKELDVQMKRMAQIQQQVIELRTKIGILTADAS